MISARILTSPDGGQVEKNLIFVIFWFDWPVSVLWHWADEILHVTRRKHSPFWRENIWIFSGETSFLSLLISQRLGSISRVIVLQEFKSSANLNLNNNIFYLNQIHCFMISFGVITNRSICKASSKEQDWILIRNILCIFSFMIGNNC